MLGTVTLWIGGTASWSMSKNVVGESACARSWNFYYAKQVLRWPPDPPVHSAFTPRPGVAWWWSRSPERGL